MLSNGLKILFDDLGIPTKPLYPVVFNKLYKIVSTLSSLWCAVTI